MLLRKIQKYCDSLSAAQNVPEIRNCFFVVPSSFGPARLQALRDAATIANFQVQGFYRGPAAISAIYGVKHPIATADVTKHVLLVDMGSSEFTITLSKFSQNQAEVHEIPYLLFENS